MNEGSSLDTLFNFLNTGINNNSWLLAWKMVTEETNKLSRKYYVKQEK